MDAVRPPKRAEDAVALSPLLRHVYPSVEDEGLGDRLRRLRGLRRLTQEQLSERSGVRRDYIANLERGKVSVPRDPENLRLLATALGVPLRELAQNTGWYDPDTDAPQDWRSLLLSDPRLNESAKQALLRIIEPLLAEEPEEKPESKKRAG